MNRIDLTVQRDATRAWLKKLDDIRVGCDSCEYAAVHAQQMLCRKFDAVPPPEVRQAGCDEWVYDQVPF